MQTKSEPKNLVWHHTAVTRAQREVLNAHRSMVLWLTGLSGAGKSTLAHAVEERLHRMGCRSFVMDGDNVRHGLCSDLGFTEAGRVENVRRVAEVAKLFVDAGVIAITAFISPFSKDRQYARSLFVPGDFLEIHCDCPLAECERRDVKGMYRRARAGEIPLFTGVGSPYEVPRDAEIVIRTDQLSLEESVDRIIAALVERGVIPEAGMLG
jgi:adenylylsulfate kinase